MKTSNRPQPDSSAAVKITVGVVAIVALTGTALAAVYYWPEGPQPKIENLQRQMLAADAGQLTERQKERVRDQLIREVDQLDDRQRDEVWDGVRDQFRQRVRSGVEKFQGLPESEHADFVDAELADLGRWRYMLYTMGPQEPYVPRRFRKSEQEAIAREEAQAKEAAAAEAAQSALADSRGARGEARGANRGEEGRSDRGARRSDGGGDRRSNGGGDRRGSDRGRRRGWVEPEEGMEDEYAAYWEAIQSRRRELWEARRGPRERSSRGEGRPQRD